MTANSLSIGLGLALLFLIVVGILLSDAKSIWQRRRFFLWTNRLQWALSAPYLVPLRNNKVDWWHTAFLATLPLTFLYGVFVYVALAPLRLFNALYFDIFLFWSVTLRNAIDDLIRPNFSNLSKAHYVIKWLVNFPIRLFHFTWRSLFGLFQGVAMLLFDLLWPTLTLFHGTSDEAAREIAGQGLWMAGSGAYVGTGLYFGMDERIARHYARSKSSPTIIVTRVTLTPCRAVSTLPKEARRHIGKDGKAFSKAIQFPWVSVQHWRKDLKWFEFCITLSAKEEKVRPWRIRPICIVDHNQPRRLSGGPARWPNDRRSASVLASSLLAFALVMVVVLRPTPAMPQPLVAQASADCLATQLAVDTSAEVVADAVNMREFALMSSRVISVVDFGRILTITDGPLCTDDGNWWQVQIDDLSGWMFEGASGAERFLIPNQ